MKKVISILVLLCFLITGHAGQYPVFAQPASPSGWDFPLPAPGVMVPLSLNFSPAVLKGITIHPENPLMFDFIIYRGDKILSNGQKQDEYKKLVKYFLASLAIPDEDQWVNLSPYEKDRIVKDDFGKTEMGRDLLAQDYILKQITASLIYPEKDLGKKFWATVYAKAQQQYGTTNIPVNTFNKVWILPDQALVYEKNNTAYILKSHLKVMLEEDYFALSKHQRQPGDMASAVSPGRLPSDSGWNVKAPQGNHLNAIPATHTIASQVVREIVLPALEKEVNEGKNFSMLRQVYSGMILAAWFKRTLKKSILGQIYADKTKLAGILIPNSSTVIPAQAGIQNMAINVIYQRYLQAYKKGVFNYIKEDADKYTNETIPRKYFSGGFFNNLAMITETTDDPELGKPVMEGQEGDDDVTNVLLDRAMAPSAAMSTEQLQKVMDSIAENFGERQIKPEKKTQIYKRDRMYDALKARLKDKGITLGEKSWKYVQFGLKKANTDGLETWVVNKEDSVKMIAWHMFREKPKVRVESNAAMNVVLENNAVYQHWLATPDSEFFSYDQPTSGALSVKIQIAKDAFASGLTVNEVQRIIKIASHQDLTGTHLAGRSFVFQLSPGEQMRRQGRVLRFIRIKAVTYNGGQPVMKPYSDIGNQIKQPSHILELGSNDNIFLRPIVVIPQGTELLPYVMNEYALMRQAFDLKNQTSYPLGTGVFLDPKMMFEGKPVGFVIIAQEQMGDKSIGDRFIDFLRNMEAAPAKELLGRLKNSYKNFISDTMLEAMALRQLHNSGITHSQPNPDNFTKNANSVTLYDFTDAKSIQNMKSKEEFVTWMFNDFLVLYETTVIISKQNMSFPRMKINLGRLGFDQGPYDVIAESYFSNKDYKLIGDGNIEKGKKRLQLATSTEAMLKFFNTTWKTAPMLGRFNLHEIGEMANFDLIRIFEKIGGDLYDNLKASHAMVAKTGNRAMTANAFNGKNLNYKGLLESFKTELTVDKLRNINRIKAAYGEDKNVIYTSNPPTGDGNKIAADIIAKLITTPGFEYDKRFNYKLIEEGDSIIFEISDAAMKVILNKNMSVGDIDNALKQLGHLMRERRNRRPIALGIHKIIKDKVGPEWVDFDQIEGVSIDQLKSIFVLPQAVAGKKGIGRRKLFFYGGAAAAVTAIGGMAVWRNSHSAEKPKQTVNSPAPEGPATIDIVFNSHTGEPAARLVLGALARVPPGHKIIFFGEDFRGLSDLYPIIDGIISEVKSLRLTGRQSLVQNTQLLNINRTLKLSTGLTVNEKEAQLETLAALEKDKKLLMNADGQTLFSDPYLKQRAGIYAQINDQQKRKTSFDQIGYGQAFGEIFNPEILKYKVQIVLEGVSVDAMLMAEAYNRLLDEAEKAFIDRPDKITEYLKKMNQSLEAQYLSMYYRDQVVTAQLQELAQNPQNSGATIVVHRGENHYLTMSYGIEGLKKNAIPVHLSFESNVHEDPQRLSISQYVIYSRVREGKYDPEIPVDEDQIKRIFFEEELGKTLEMSDGKQITLIKAKNGADRVLSYQKLRKILEKLKGAELDAFIKTIQDIPFGPKGDILALSAYIIEQLKVFHAATPSELQDIFEKVTIENQQSTAIVHIEFSDGRKPGDYAYAKSNRAMMSARSGQINASKAMLHPKGGIDLNSANLAMLIKRDGKGVVLPLAQQDLAQLGDIEGLEPEILSIKPASQTPEFVQLAAH